MKTEKSKKLRGSVLLTVVSVMSLLIIFLSGTLVLASAANNRAHVNYSSAQAGITSRAVADAAVRAIGASESYANAVASMKAGSTPLSVPVKFESSLDADGNSKTNIGSFGKIQDVTVEYAGTKSYYNETEKVWEPKDLLKFTANVTLGGVTSTTTSYVVKDPPQPSGGGGGGGAGFVTVGDAELDCQTNLYGGSYTNLPSLDKAQQIEDNGYENYCPENKFWFQNDKSLIEADSMINGTMDGGQLEHIVFPGMGTGITIWGNWIINAAAAGHFDYSCTHWNPESTVKFNEIPYIYVNGEISGAYMKFGSPSPSDSNKGAFPLNIFCGSINCNNGDRFDCYADIYCMDDDATSCIVVDADKTKLYQWSASVINKTVDDDAQSYVGGNIYTKGSLNMGTKNGGGQNYVIDGSIIVEDDLIFNDNSNGTLNVTIKKNLVVGGSLIVGSGVKLDVQGNIYLKGANVSGITLSESQKAIDGVTSVDNTPIEWDWVVKDGYIRRDNIKVTATRINTTNQFSCSNGSTINNVNVEEDEVTVYISVDKDGNADPNNWSFDEKYTFFKNIDSNNKVKVSKEEGAEQVPVKWTTPYGEESDYAYTFYDEDGHVIDDPSSMVYTAYSLNGKEIKDPSVYGKIYPEYAERDVLIGLKEIDGVDKSDTQVTKTIKQVLEEVVNPYDSSGLPPNVNEIYDMLKSDRDSYTVHSAAEAKTKATKNGKKVVTGVSSSGGVVSITTDDDVAGSPYINKSCILDWSTGADEFKGGKQIVIDPDGSILLVVIKNFSLENGYNIIIDDSKNGSSVYFYVEENSTLSIAGNGGIITTSYKGIFDNKTPFQVYTKDEYKLTDGTPSLQDLGCGNPKVYVYGGANSTLSMPNFVYMTFNILSPNITVYAGGDGSEISKLGEVNMYYNGRKMEGGNYMFGCCNSNTTTFPNQMNTVYIPSGSSDPPEVGTPDLSHWFKVLYYDEY